MLISIIITNYNYAEYLNDCIDSCLSQVYKNDIEIIVVDDGSHDNSKEIILSYSSCIKPIFKPNGGQASAFNAGFAACAGDVVLFLDSDDMLMPHCLDRISQNWSDSFSKIHFNLLMINKSGGSLGETFCKKALPRGDLKASILKTGNYQSMPTSGNAFSRSFLNKVMPMLETVWRGHADAYLINLAPLAGYVGAIDEPLGFYRIHDKNISSHLSESRLNFDKVYTSIVREIDTDEIIYKFCNINGFEYKLGKLVKSYPHLQLLLIHDKLSNLFGRVRFRSPLTDFFNLTVSIFKLENISFTKIILIHTWMFLILIAPSKLAERMVIFGYERGAMLFARRPPQRRPPPGNKRAIPSAGPTDP